MATILGKHEISLTSIFQPQHEEHMENNGLAEIVWITHQVKEEKIQTALTALKSEEVVSEIANVIRVEGK